MTTSNPNNPSLLDRVEGFFKGSTKKTSTPTLTSSLEHLHTSQHAQADAEAQHQAALMSGMPPGMPEGTQSLSSETLPQPMPRQVLNEVLGAGGQVPHATHVDIDKVEQQHEQAVGPLGTVQEPGLLDKAKSAIDSITGKSTTTSTQPIQHHPDIPHAALPDATLKQVQTAHGHPPHAHHVDVGTVEQRHEQNLGLGHVQQEPSVLTKMSNKLQDLVPPTTFASTTTTTTTQPTIQTHPNIPHAAVTDQVLEDVQSQKGKVPHATHVDIGKVEQQHEQAVGPLGTVLKEPTLLDKVASKIQGLVYPSATPTTTSTVNIQSHPHIPHSALSNPVLRDIQAQHGKVPHARHVDIKSIERKYEQSLGLGHVHGTPTVLLDKAKLAVDKVTGKSVAPLTHKPIQHHPYIPHSALSDATLQQIYNAHGRPYRARHVNIRAVERAQEQRMIDAVGPLGRVLRSPNLLDKMSDKIQSLVQPSTTTAPTTLTQDIESQRGKVPHATHVNIDKVEQKHEQALGVPLGHVQQPSLLDKAKQMILGTTPTTQPLQHHPYIPHSALSDATLKQIQNAHGHPIQARHVNIDAVEKAHEQRMIQAIGPLGHVQKGPTTLGKMSNKLQSLVQPSTAPATLTQDIESQRGKVPHARHVDIKQVEKQHEQALGVPLGHVQKEPNVLEKMGARVQEMLYPTAAAAGAASMLYPTTTTTTTTTTSDIHPASIEPRTNIPHAAVPDDLLRDVESQRGKVPHATHVDIGQVERRHDQAVGPLGHVQEEPGVLTKMGDKLHDMMNRPTTTTIPLTSTTAPTATRSSDLPATTSSDLPSSTSQHPYIPHAAVSDQVLRDVESQKGKVPHAHHVDVGPIEQRHEQAVGPLGHVQKEPTLMDKAKYAVGLGDTAAVSHPTANIGNYNNLPADQRSNISNIPHAALPDQVLKDVQHQKGKVPHAHHVDIDQVEARHNQAVGPLGHVQKEPTLMDKAKHAVGLGDKSKDTTTPATTRTDDIPSHQRTNAGFVGGNLAEPPVVLTEPVLLSDPVNARFRDTSATSRPAPTTTTNVPTTDTANLPVDQGSNIPHAAVPDQVLKDVQHQKGKVPHAHHVDVGQVEQRHDQAVGPLGHVQKEPTLMDKAKHAVGLGGDTTSTSRPTTTTRDENTHPNIPHAAVSDQVLHDVQHQKGKVPHAHHVDIGQVEARHIDAVGPLGHVQKEPTLMDKAKHAVGLGDKSKDTTPSTTTTTAPSTTSTTAPAAAAAVPLRTQDMPSQRTNQGFVGGNLAEPPVVLSDAPTEPMAAPVPQRQPTLLDKMEYHIFGVDPIHSTTGLGTTAPTTTTGNTAPTTAGTTAPTTTTTGTHQDQHPNIPHAAVSDQVLKDVQKQKGKVPHAHHVDVGKVEQQHNEALGVPLGHVQKEPGLLDKAKHALGLDKSKDKDTTKDKHTTTQDISNKDKAPYPANEPRPNIMHNSLPSYVMSDIQDANGQVPNARHVDLNEMEMERSRRLALQDSIGHVMEDKTQPNIMHNSLPTRVMNELKDQQGHVPHANHVDINQVEHDRDANLSQSGLIGRVVDPSKRPNVMHSSLPTRVLSDIESSEGQVPNARHVDSSRIERDRDRNLAQEHDIGRVMDGSSNQPNIMHNSLPTRVMSDVKNAGGQVPHAHHVDINQIEHDRGQRMSEAYMKGRITDPSLPGSSTVSNPMERSNSGFTAGAFPSSTQESSTTLPSSQQSSALPSSQQSSTLPSNTAYFKDTGVSSGGAFGASTTGSNLSGSSQPTSSGASIINQPTSGASSINQPASSLTSDLGYKSGLTGSTPSTSKTSGHTPLVATLPPGSNLESGSGIQFKPVDKSSPPLTSTTGSTTPTLGPHGPKFHEQK